LQDENTLYILCAFGDSMKVGLPNRLGTVNLNFSKNLSVDYLWTIALSAVDEPDLEAMFLV
jgi:hypothetical protein